MKFDNLSIRIPRKLRKMYVQWFLGHIKPIFSNHHSVCPICHWHGDMFLPGGCVEIRPNAVCPRCQSAERQRLSYLFLKEAIPKNRRLRLLHFAPEPTMVKYFRSYKLIDYLSVDLISGHAMQKEDITNLSFPDDSFDIIFCSHVLEHIEDDHKAMTELQRVLKPGGFAICLVPLKDEFNGRKIRKTYEDPSITDPKERLKHFGQCDHVRVYGRDFKDRLIRAGFHVKVIKFAESLSAKDRARFAVLPIVSNFSEAEGWIYYCTK